MIGIKLPPAMPKGDLIPPLPRRKLSDADRRWLMKAVGAAALVSLPACQSVFNLGSEPVAIEAKSGEEALTKIRSSHGLPLLSLDPALERAAAEQASYMAETGRMEHTTGRGRDFATRIRSQGINGAAAENIAQGRYDAGGLFTAWMNSSGHRRNMLDPTFSRFGLASAEGRNGVRYWALVLAR
jgi:uncharacterized protein YkwD